MRPARGREATKPATPDRAPALAFADPIEQRIRPSREERALLAEDLGMCRSDEYERQDELGALGGWRRSRLLDSGRRELLGAGAKQVTSAGLTQRGPVYGAATASRENGTGLTQSLSAGALAGRWTKVRERYDGVQVKNGIGQNAKHGEAMDAMEAEVNGRMETLSRVGEGVVVQVNEILGRSDERNLGAIA